MLLGKRQGQGAKVADEHALGQEALRVGGMAGVQCHDHHLQEWEPRNTCLSEWVMPGQAEKEYPAKIYVADGSNH